MEELPFSQACENNKTFILDILSRHLAHTDSVLEIGSGTGQHGEYFARELPALVWQTTDRAENLPGLNRRIGLAALPNLPSALSLDVTEEAWSCGQLANIFTANSLHIMSESAVEKFFRGVGRYLSNGGLLLVYGPFKYRGHFTTESNANFDAWLKSRDPASGIRDFETIDSFSQQVGLTLLEDNNMPANNQLLVWRRTQGAPA